MQKFTETTAFQKSNGDLAVLAGANVFVFVANSSTLATLFDDDETTHKLNPLASDANGLAQFKLANGTYDFQYSNGGLVVTVPGVIAYDPVDAGAYDPSNVAITGGTIDGVVIGGSGPANATFNDVTVNGNFKN
ncbi:hypothetical protein QWJ07_04030 [Frankia sp. RB7]|nr:hypothetical protein [Frankia sp. RB7]